MQNVLETLFDEWTIEVSDPERTVAQIRAVFTNPDMQHYNGGMRSVSMHVDVPGFDETGRQYPSPQLGCKFTTVERTLGD